MSLELPRNSPLSSCPARVEDFWEGVKLFADLRHGKETNPGFIVRPLQSFHYFHELLFLVQRTPTVQP